LFIDFPLFSGGPFSKVDLLVEAFNGLSNQIRSIDENVKDVAYSMQIRDSLQPVLQYGSSKITRIGHSFFRKKVMKAYGYSENEVSGSENPYCLILNRKVPKESLVAGHLFKHEWKPVCQQVVGIDIDDARNGIPIFKPLEVAFDTLQMVILCE
jgi:hypothetical protein